MTRPAMAPSTMTTETLSLPSLPPLSRLLVGAGLALARWELRHRTRGALKRLDPHLLRDIGLSPTDRASECARPFWRA